MDVKEQSVTVSRTARYYQLGQVTEETRQIWFVCHGYGYLARQFIAKFETLCDAATVIVAPEGLSRFYLSGFAGRVGACWMTKDGREDEIDDYVRYLDQVYDNVLGREPRENLKVIVLGFSQGAAAGARWVAFGKSAVHRLILWAGLVPPEFSTKQSFRKLAARGLTLVAGREDELATPDRITQHLDVLKSCHVPFTFLQFDGGHELDTNLLVELQSKL